MTSIPPDILGSGHAQPPSPTLFSLGERISRIEGERQHMATKEDLAERTKEVQLDIAEAKGTFKLVRLLLPLGAVVLVGLLEHLLTLFPKAAP